MVHSSSATSAVTQKNVIGLSILFLALAAIFGALNSHKVKVLRTNVANAEAARLALANRRVTQQQGLKPREMTGTGEGDKVSEAESKPAKAEADLAQLQKEIKALDAQIDSTLVLRESKSPRVTKIQMRAIKDSKYFDNGKSGRNVTCRACVGHLNHCSTKSDRIEPSMRRYCHGYVLKQRRHERNGETLQIFLPPSRRFFL